MLTSVTATIVHLTLREIAVCALRCADSTEQLTPRTAAAIAAAISDSLTGDPVPLVPVPLLSPSRSFAGGAVVPGALSASTLAAISGGTDLSASMSALRDDPDLQKALLQVPQISVAWCHRHHVSL